MFKFFENLIPPFEHNTEETPPKELIKFICFYTKGLWKLLCIVTILSSIIACGEAIFFYFIGVFVDILNASTADNLWEQHKNTFLLFGFLVFIFLPLCIFIRSLLINQAIRNNYTMRIRYSLHTYILKHSLSFFNNDLSGRLSQKLAQTTQGIRDTVLKLFDVIVHMFVYFLAMLGMLAETSGYLLLIMSIWFVIYVLLLRFFIPKLRALSVETAERRSKMVGSIVDSYSNIQTVKLFANSVQENSFMVSEMQRCLDIENQLTRTITKFSCSVQYLNYCLMGCLVIASMMLWTKGAILVGSIAVTLGLAIRVNNLSQWVMWELGLLFDNIGMVKNGIDSFATPIEIQEPSEPKHFTAQVKGHIVFKDVAFKYNEHVEVFKNLNLEIKPGERIGIVGHSGSGKSTLVNLLLRFYDVEKGSISVDGLDIREVLSEELRANIAMVTQDTSLLHRSIRDNITYGKGGNDNILLEAQMQKAAEEAEAIQFIERLSDSSGNTGFDTRVGERGVKLSGGQRQRIAIARVILKNAPILILDEATSALDSDVEEIVKDNLYNLMKDKTVIAIAHRLSTIAAMDRLIVLKDGDIAEIGTHEELLALNGIYAQLWHKQTGGFIGQ